MSNKPQSRKAKEIESRNELIMSVAQSLLAEKGLQGLTMQAIADLTEYSKGTIYQQFENEMFNQFRDLGYIYEDLNENSVPQDQDQEAQIAHMKQIKEFFYKFAFKLEIFDPLDRPTPNQEEDHAIKRDNLVNKIEKEMPSMLGSELFVPLSNDKYRKLQKLFEQELEACNEVVEEHVLKAQEMGE